MALSLLDAVFLIARLYRRQIWRGRRQFTAEKINTLLVVKRDEQPYFNSCASKPVLFDVRQIDSPQEVFRMLWTIFVILLVLWLVGLVSSYTLGGFIHLLLVAAVVVLILQLISGRRAAL
jgi:Family of unknown function (DUF5670)